MHPGWRCWLSLPASPFGALDASPCPVLVERDTLGRLHPASDMSTSVRPIKYQFGHFVLLPAERQLIKHGIPVSLGPRAFDVLQILLEQSGALVEKKILLERAWPGLVVEDNTLQAVISTLRKVLGPDAIATVSKFGYRFNLHFDVEQPEEHRSEAAVSHGHPVFQSSFVGRQRELLALSQLLQRARNVTIHGPGGAGKTRLALETALSLSSRFGAGFRFLDLASMSEDSMLTHRAAALFGLGEGPTGSSYQILIEHLRDQALLLVIDNAEHMVSSVALMVDEVLAGCSQVVVLVTSRQPTGSIGELLFPIPALSLPDVTLGQAPEQMLASDSFRLFVERARLQKPHLALTPDTVANIVKICHRLDGMPLSIELAASRMRTMSVAEIDTRLDQALRLLVSQASEAPKRHQTLRALIEWSYGLLSSEERGVFRRVSVFSGGFTLDMVEAVFSSAGVPSWTLLEVLETLTDKSMLSVERADATIRYRHLETVRQFASEKLTESGESFEWKRLHLKYFAQQVSDAVAGSAYISEALRALGDEQDNLEAALQVALTDDELILLGLQMTVGMTRYWFTQGRHLSGRSWLSRFLDKAPPGTDDLLRIRAQSWVGVFLDSSGDHAEATAAHNKAVRLARIAKNGPGALLALGNSAMSLGAQGEHAMAMVVLLEAIGLLGRTIKNQVAIELAGLPQYAPADLADRLPEHEHEILAAHLATQLKTPGANLGLQLRNLGMHLTRSGDYLNAERALLEAIRLVRIEGDTFMVGGCLSVLGNVAERLGKSQESLGIFIEAFQALAPTGEDRVLCTAIDGLAGALFRCGNTQLAIRFWGASERLSLETHFTMDAGDKADRADNQALARDMLGDAERYEAIFRGGYNAGIDQLLSEVLK